MEKSGVLSDKVLGGRVFVLSAKMFVETVKMLGASISQPAADALFWNMGHRYGLALGNKLKEKSPDEGIMLLSAAAMNSGWGVPNVVNNYYSEGVIEVSFENCVFCDGLAGSDSPRCYFLTGILTGIAESLYHESFKTLETECIAKNNPVCRFVIQRE
ncbi:MAG: 4-vinyl reductase [Candidatus Caldarchaeum sp.]